MMDEKHQLALFDYKQLDLDTRSFVQTKTAEIRVLVKQTAQGIIEIGQRLIEVKERLGHGNFLPWLDKEFGWSNDTAQRFMNVAKNLPQIPHGAEFQSKALYLLASPSTPEPARQEALERAEQGEAISHKAAQEIVDRYKAQVKDLTEKLSKAERLGTLNQDLAREAQGYKEEAAQLREKLTEEQEKEPETIEVEKIVEKEVIKAPKDYKKTKKELEKLKKELDEKEEKINEIKHNLETTQETSFNRGAEIKQLLDEIYQKKTQLAIYETKEREVKVLSLLSQSQKDIREACSLFNMKQEEVNLQFNDQTKRSAISIIEDLQAFLKEAQVINIGG